MLSLRNLKIKYKILIIALVGIIGFALYLAMNYQVTLHNSERFTAVSNQHFPVLERVDINITYLDRLKYIWDFSVTTGDEDLVEDAQEISLKVATVYQEIINIDLSTKQDIEQLSEIFSDYFSRAKALTLAMIEDNLTPNKIEIQASQLVKTLKDYESALQAFRQVQHDQFNAILSSANQESRNNLLWGLMIGIAIMIILGGTALAISKAISGGINKVMHAMGHLAEGDLTAHVKYSGTDEIGQLANYYNASTLAIRELIEGIVNTAAQLNSVSNRVLSTMQQTSNSVNLQHLETDQLATAITQMVATVAEVARNTGAAADATQVADGQANEGLKVVTATGQSIQMLANEVESAATAIQSLKEDSKNIGAVLDVIRAIAEQTNLLALNAAIEAARAGEQGRGFAVVADEVRSLASRTQAATLEIQTTIKNLQLGAQNAVEVMEKGQAQANESVEQSRSAGKLLNNINTEVNAIADMNVQIATAAEQQASVAEEINKSIVSINTLADQTTSNTRESTDNASEMASLALHLGELVGRFKVS